MSCSFGSKVLSPTRTIKVPHANGVDPNAMPRNLAFHPDPSCLTTRKHFHQLCATLKRCEKY